MQRGTIDVMCIRMSDLVAEHLESVGDRDADNAGRDAVRLREDRQNGGREHNQTADNVHVELHPPAARYDPERVHVVLVRTRSRLGDELRLSSERHDRCAAYEHTNQSHTPISSILSESKLNVAMSTPRKSRAY